MSIAWWGQIMEDAQTLWEYNAVSETARKADVCLGLGSHDLGVATRCAELYLNGFVPLIVFSGANAPTTIERFPRGEARHYAEEAIRQGVPQQDILIEPMARNTGENISRSRQLLDEHEIRINSMLLVSRPYQQRRAVATAQLLWPEIDTIPSPQAIGFQDYLKQIGDADQVKNMLVGDTQRVIEYPNLGFAAKQDVPEAIHAAMKRLIKAGYTARLLH